MTPNRARSIGIALSPSTIERAAWLLVGLVLAIVIPDATAQTAPQRIRIYLDADRTNAVSSGEAIEAGMRAGLRRHGDQVAGTSVELVMMDHRGNVKRKPSFARDIRRRPRRVRDLLRHALASGALASGRHQRGRSPDARSVGGGGPITRPPEGPNWIFRLSIDDANAGVFIAHEAIARGVRKPALLLENTGWGKSNERTMTRAIREKLAVEASVTWFNWGVSEARSGSCFDRSRSPAPTPSSSSGTRRKGRR